MKLVKYSEVNKTQFEEYIQEWEKSGEKIVPSACKRRGKSFPELLDNWKISETDHVFSKGLVPSTLYFYTDEDNTIYGAIHFRHELNDRLTLNGGHIGYGVRPTQRMRGYGKEMLSLLLRQIWKDGYKKILITCDDDNIASAKTIEKNAGMLFDKPIFEGILTRRYLITSPKE